MASPIQAQLILCDAAVADPTGKLHMLGAGWSITTSPTHPQAVAVLLQIPWDRANQRLPVLLRLLDSDGQPATIQTPEGPQQISMNGEFESGRPPGVAHGSDLPASFAFNVPSLPLTPGRYQWRLDVSDNTFASSFQVISQT